MPTTINWQVDLAIHSVRLATDMNALTSFANTHEFKIIYIFVSIETEQCHAYIVD